MHFVLALAVAMVGLAATNAPATSSTATTPIVVGSPTEVPAGAVENIPSQYATAGECDTTRSWTLTVPPSSKQQYRHPLEKRTYSPGAKEVSHQEYRWPLLKRTYTPGQDEVSHLVYAYKKVTPAVQGIKEYEFDKYVQKQKAKWSGTTYVGPISAGYAGSYTWRDAGFASVWNTTGVAPTAPGPVRGEFIHNSGGTWYFTFFYEYRKISERWKVEPQPEKVELSGERTTTLGSPWVLLPGYPKKVVDKAAVPASFSPWVADGYTSWSKTATAPADPDGQTGDTNPLNLRMVGSPRQEIKVVDSAAVPASFTPWVFDTFTAWSDSSAAPADPDGQDGETNPLNLRRVSAPMEQQTVEVAAGYTQQYVWSDNKVCATTTTPTPTPTVTPTDDTEVLPVEASGKAVGSLKVSCQGTVRVTMKNRSSEQVKYTVKIAKRSKSIAVGSGKTRKWVTSAAPLQRAQLFLGGKLLASKRLPKACGAPEVLPETGARS